MAQIYVNLTETDAAEHMDLCERTQGAGPMPPLPQAAPQTDIPRTSRKAQRMIDGMRKKLATQRLAEGVSARGVVVVQFPRRPEPPVAGAAEAVAA